MTTILRDGTTTEDPRLDALVSFDEQSRSYPVTAILTRDLPRSKHWWIPKPPAPLDQGREGACVGFAWTHEISARPNSTRNVDDTLALEIYRAAQKIDEWPGEAYSGTSVLAGVKVLQKMGFIEEYRWAFTLMDVLLTVSWHGPVILGINWHDSMYDTNMNGYVIVKGSPIGRHAIMLRGIRIVKKDWRKPATLDNIDLHKSYGTLFNSWGPTWGKKGDGKISLHDLDALRRAQGEVCVPVKRHSVDR